LSLSTQVYKWVRGHTAGGNPAMDWHPIQGGVAILSVASCYRNWDNLQPCGPPWPACDFILFYPLQIIWAPQYMNLSCLSFTKTRIHSCMHNRWWASNNKGYYCLPCNEELYPPITITTIATCRVT